MAGDKQYITQGYGAVFGDGKAYTLSISNGKVRLSVASSVNNNGKSTWDFRNSSGINLDFEDVNKVTIACKTLAHIYLVNKKNPGAAAVNPLYGTSQVRIPLVAKMNGTVFGELVIAIVADSKSPADKTFGFKYSYQNKDGVTTSDHFIFRRSSGPESEIQFIDMNGNNLHTSHHEHTMFANFIHMLESILDAGRVSFGLQTALKYTSGGNNNGGGNRGGYSGGGNNNGGGYSGGGNSGSDSGDVPDDIPF